MKHTLPQLKYAFEALEPYIDAKTVELHYTKHHQAYVDGLNTAEDKLDQARKNNDFSTVKHLKREIAFHGSGHILHSLYWANMIPNGKEINKNSKLYNAIINKFGSFETFEKEFKSSALVVEGSGWAILGFINGELEIFTSEKHQNLTQWGVTPILACDVWEHAYYLKYQNKRVEYIDNFWKVIDWSDVESRF